MPVIMFYGLFIFGSGCVMESGGIMQKKINDERCGQEKDMHGCMICEEKKKKRDAELGRASQR